MQETMDLVKKFRFPSLFINQFFPRPGTPAAKMKRIPTQVLTIQSFLGFFAHILNKGQWTDLLSCRNINALQDVKLRTKELTEYFLSYKPYDNRIGKIYRSVYLFYINWRQGGGRSGGFRSIWESKRRNINGKQNRKLGKKTSFTKISAQDLKWKD